MNNLIEPIPFYPFPPHEWFDADLYRRMSDKEIIIAIDNGFPGMQVVVFTDKHFSPQKQ